MEHPVKTLLCPHRRIPLLLAALIWGMASSASAFEFEYWPKVIVAIPLDEHWQFGFEERLSFADDARRLDNHQTDLVVTYSGLADWLSVGVGYKAVFERAGDDWLIENRPYLNVAVKTKLHGFGLTDRSRFEYRVPEDQDEVWRYRNRLTITSPMTLTPWKILPYVAEEIFVNFDEEGFNQQRLYAGFFVPLHQQIRLELFYLWKLDEEGDEWHDTNVIGSWVYVQF